MFRGVFGERDGTLFPARCSFRRSSRSRCGKNGQLSRRLRSFRFPKRRFGLGRRGELYARSCLSVTSLHTRCCVAGPYVRIGVGCWPACAAPACAGMLVIGRRRQVCGGAACRARAPHLLIDIYLLCSCRACPWVVARKSLLIAPAVPDAATVAILQCCFLRASSVLLPPHDKKMQQLLYASLGSIGHLAQHRSPLPVTFCTRHIHSSCQLAKRSSSTWLPPNVCH